jgi:hypothetical protein
MNSEFFIAVVIMIAGIVSIWWMERNAEAVSKT